MHGKLSDVGARASFAAAQSGQVFLVADNVGSIRPKNRFASLVKSAFGKKADVAIAQYAHVPDRTARGYKGKRRAPAEVLIDLLLGAEGFRVLTHIMDVPDPPTWWVVLQHERQLAALAGSIFKQLSSIVNA